MIAFAVVVLGMVGGINVEDISYMMDIYIDPEYRDGNYFIVQLIVLKEGVDIPDLCAYYSYDNMRIVIEEICLKPASLYMSGNCGSVLWHEILHARWGGGEEEDHMRMQTEQHCS